jgi:hypothetical protein
MMIEEEKMAEKTYSCEICLKEKTPLPGEKVPECCGRPMALKLESCRTPFVAETARPGSADEPCDDDTNRDE